MSYTITLQPSGQRFSAAPGQSLLQSALDAGVLLPYGCRNGACGSCKGRLIQGQVAGGMDGPVLSAADRMNGAVLTCCAEPQSDLVLECREVPSGKSIQARTLPARVQKLQRLAPDVMEIHLQLPASERLQFIAGQYIDILLKDGRRRSFSMANPPHSDGYLQLHVRWVPGGEYTSHVFNVMKEREILRFNGPHGGFCLQEDSAKPVILLAGGTGFAPIKAMVEDAIHKRCERPISLYWGSRDRAGLYMDDLARSWAEQHPSILYIPVLSDSADGDGWQGRRGLVHQAVMADYPDLSAHQVYACGAPAMIDAARRDFCAHCALPEGEFFSDAFTFATPAG